MSKAQGFVLAALLATALINIASNPGGFGAGVATVFGKIGSGQAKVLSIFALYWLGALIILFFLADVAPVIASWIAGLILLGAVLVKGPQALKLGGK